MMDEALQRELIQKGREFTKGDRREEPYPDFESDQDLRRPQPSLVKAPMAGQDARVVLPRDFDGLSVRNDFAGIIRDRRSRRVYTDQPVTLAQLSFLLWATQGVKGIRGKAYATLRTVPCGGARHEFETYLLVRKVEGLVPGAYHYLPMEHALERLGPVADMEGTIDRSLVGQKWAAKASVVFYWAMVPYRAEWRYGIYAHRCALMDAGHIGQNLYLGCTALGLGACCLGSFCHEECAELFGLDGEEEYVVYAAPVGTVRDEDRTEEQAFYRFVEEEGL